MDMEDSQQPLSQRYTLNMDISQLLKQGCYFFLVDGIYNIYKI